MKNVITVDFIKGACPMRSIAFHRELGLVKVIGVSGFMRTVSSSRHVPMKSNLEDLPSGISSDEILDEEVILVEEHEVSVHTLQPINPYQEFDHQMRAALDAI